MEAIRIVPYYRSKLSFNRHDLEWVFDIMKKCNDIQIRRNLKEYAQQVMNDIQTEQVIVDYHEQKIKELPETEQEILKKVYFEDYTLKQFAEEKHISRISALYLFNKAQEMYEGMCSHDE